MNAGPIDAGAGMLFRIGQHVRHRDYKGQRVTGVVRSLSIEGDGGLIVGIALDAPIVIPAGDGQRPIDIWNQHAPAHEFSPFDERDELIAEMLAALALAAQALGGSTDPTLLGRADRAVNAAVAKAAGAAA